ncbi:uncharacterized protein LOC141628269 [Silene latifolia]|uniref:uncharacterized protein LOC141628269 n=1 Tax=Silene latifolia TaxID=37657 RepID=UPI003D76C5A4
MDIWYWNAEKDGMYSVKSAYRSLAGGDGMEVSGSSDRESEMWLWKRLWNVPVWPRVKMFFWQLCSEALATRANIASRIRGDISFCSLCNSFYETNIHLFKNCGVAQKVWEGLGLGGGVGATESGIRDWVEERWRELGGREHRLFMLGCWAIWEHRNKVIFDAKEVDPMVVIRRVGDVVAELEGSEHEVRRGRRRREDGMGVEDGGSWRPAPSGCVKINVDAGVKEGEGVSLCLVCRDDRGAVLWGISVVQDQVWEPHVAEAVAVLEGAKEAMRLGYKDIVMESDCAQVIEALNKKQAGRSSFMLVIDEVLCLSVYFNFVVWSFSSRVNNSVAHALAHVYPRISATEKKEKDSNHGKVIQHER